MKGKHRNAVFENVLLQSKLETQECSVLNLNRELYDNIGQLLSSTKLLLSMVTMQLHHVPDALKTAEHSIGKAIQDLRLLSKSISDEWMHQFNLVKHLGIETVCINGPGKVNMQVCCEIDTLPLEPATQVILSRLLHETVSSSIDNDDARQLTIEIKNKDNLVEIILGHDGNNSFKEKKQDSLYQHIQQRIKLLGGTIKWIEAPKGTAIIFSVPVEE
jgi:signal transduction histidine kinase